MKLARIAWPVVALGFLLALPASAEPERIRFTKGQSSAELNGTAPGMTEDYQGPRDYVLRASAGQQMTVKFEGEDAWYTVLCPGPGTTDAGAADWSMTLPESGDYRIRVSAKGKQDAPYSLTVGVIGKPAVIETSGLTGTYAHLENDATLEVEELPGGKLKFSLLAFHHGPAAETYGPDIGEAGGEVSLADGVAVYDGDDCRLTMKLASDAIEIEQEGGCDFGHNVTANGSYRRRSPCAAPGHDPTSR